MLIAVEHKQKSLRNKFIVCTLQQKLYLQIVTNVSAISWFPVSTFM